MPHRLTLAGVGACWFVGDQASAEPPGGAGSFAPGRRDATETLFLTGTKGPGLVL
jgi:hypothetical protein